jgi:hypothetical protein
MPWSWESTTLIARVPLSADTEPLGGATMLWVTTGGRLPIVGQVTVEVVRM